MCGRVIQSSAPLRLAIVEGLAASDTSDSWASNSIRTTSLSPIRQTQ